MNDDHDQALAQQRATIERVAEMMHQDDRTLARIFDVLPGGNIVANLAVLLTSESNARCLAWAIGRLIRKNPIYVAQLFEHALFCDIDEDEWSNEKLLKVLGERLAIER